MPPSPVMLRSNKPYIVGKSDRCVMQMEGERGSEYAPHAVWVSQETATKWFKQVLEHPCRQGGILRDPEGALGWDFKFHHPYLDRPIPGGR